MEDGVRAEKLGLLAKRRRLVCVFYRVTIVTATRNALDAFGKRLCHGGGVDVTIRL
jgi:hypothetical protein